MGVLTLQHYPWAMVCFLVFLLVCTVLLELRFGRRETFFVAVGFLIGIASVQVALFASGWDEMLILTLLPFIAYLPAAIGIFVLSCTGLLQTAAVLAMGAMMSFVVALFQKSIIAGGGFGFGPSADLAQAICVLLVAGALVFVVYRWLRAPFRACVLHGGATWLLLCLSTVAVLLMLSYTQNSPIDPTMTALSFVIALCVIAIAARMLVASERAQRAHETEEAVAVQLDIQRREYEDILGKLKVRQVYRHDMRHHLLVLEGLAGKEGNKQIAHYLSGLDSRLHEADPEVYCENPAVNAVLSSFVGRARKADCVMKVKACVPADLPFDALDVCAVLANALENAIHACESVPTERRRIDVTALVESGWSLRVCIENTCSASLKIGPDGLPLSEGREGRGIGLKSIQAVVSKYQGLLRCSCKEGTFCLQAALFYVSQPDVSKRRTTPSDRVLQKSLTLACAGLVIIGCLQMVVCSLDGLLGTGVSSAVADPGTTDFKWGATEFHADVPRVREDVASVSGYEAEDSVADEPGIPTRSEVPFMPPIDPPPSGTISWESDSDAGASAGLEPAAPIVSVVPKPPAPDGSHGPSGAPPDISEGIDDINRQMETYVASMRDTFIWYAERRYMGYVGMDVVYEVVRNDGYLLSIRFDTVLNAGGSGGFSRTFTLDMRTGEVLELADLFCEGGDYVSAISGDVLRQMAAQVDAGLADYFIAGGIWSPDECFKEIASDQHFYINDQNRLVIVFDEYEVAPGSVGMPEFVVSSEALAGILPPSSLIN